MESILIDANIFLEVLLEQKKADICKTFLEQVAHGKSAYVSTFTIDAISIIMSKHNISPDKIALFINSLLNYAGLIIYPANMKDRIFAASLMKKYSLDYEDALTLQCAISAGCSKILSFDLHFEKIKEIKRVEPREGI